jgi:hypothetical protein
MGNFTQSNANVPIRRLPFGVTLDRRLPTVIMGIQSHRSSTEIVTDVLCYMGNLCPASPLGISTANPTNQELNRISRSIQDQTTQDVVDRETQGNSTPFLDGVSEVREVRRQDGGREIGHEDAEIAMR